MASCYLSSPMFSTSPASAVFLFWAFRIRPTAFPPSSAALPSFCVVPTAPRSRLSFGSLSLFAWHLRSLSSRFLYPAISRRATCHQAPRSGCVPPRNPIPMRREIPNTYTEPLFSVRRTPRACHGGCNRLRPGSLRASHAVCLASRTLEPAICDRKEATDIESVSTTGSTLAEGLVMQRNLSESQTVSFGFYATSRHCIPPPSPRNSNSAKRLTMALQRTAPRVTVAAVHVRCRLVRSWRSLTSVAALFVPPSQLPRRAPQSLSLSR